MLAAEVVQQHKSTAILAATATNGRKKLQERKKHAQSEMEPSQMVIIKLFYLEEGHKPAQIQALLLGGN